MRTLERNKTKLWVVSPAVKTEAVDIDGNPTGEFVSTFGSAVEVKIALYPSNGLIKEEIFGRDYSCDKIAVSGDVVLTKNTLLFLSEPTTNFDTTYDFKVDKINESLNTFQYALRSRV